MYTNSTTQGFLCHKYDTKFIIPVIYLQFLEQMRLRLLMVIDVLFFVTPANYPVMNLTTKQFHASCKVTSTHQRSLLFLSCNPKICFNIPLMRTLPRKSLRSYSMSSEDVPFTSVALTRHSSCQLWIRRKNNASRK